MFAEDIKKFFRGSILTDEKTLELYSRDYSIFEIKPQLVLYPKDSEDLKNLVNFVREKRKKRENLSLTARSAGTDMTGGPLSESIVIVFTKNFNQIKEIKDNYVRVEPGVYFRDLEKELKNKNLLYPPYPASKEICALGGMIANNSGGEKTLFYGKTEDYVEELKVVLSDGEEYLLRPITKEELNQKIGEKGFLNEIYKKLLKLLDDNFDLIKKSKPEVSKNSAGYALWNVWDKNTFDITKLFVGAQGTLGFITEAKLKLVSQKRFRKLAVIFLRDLNGVADLVVQILKYKPESLESYDDKTLFLALKFLPGILRLMKGNAVKLFWKFWPEVGMILKGGLPKLVMLAEFSSNDEKKLDQEVKEFKEAISRMGFRVRIAKDEADAEKYWTIRRQSFKLLHEHTKNKEAAAFIDDVVVKPEHLPEFLPRLNQILDKYKNYLTYTIAGHPGDGNFHIIPLMDLKKPEVRALIPKISEEVYDLVLEYKGSFTAEHNDGLIRTPYLEKMYGPKVNKLFREVKRIFDPLNIFNPGKKVDGSLNYALEHIKK
ncbi:MAG: FAD-binding oxidoreductase [Patescibacteria group bacterium]